jgi:hypothetical protein
MVATAMTDTPAITIRTIATTATVTTLAPNVPETTPVTTDPGESSRAASRALPLLRAMEDGRKARDGLEVRVE